MNLVRLKNMPLDREGIQTQGRLLGEVAKILDLIGGIERAQDDINIQPQINNFKTELSKTWSTLDIEVY